MGSPTSSRTIRAAIAREAGKPVRPIGSFQIGRDCVGAAASFAYLADDSIGFAGASAVMHPDLRAGGGVCPRAGTADTARGAGDECSLS